MKILWVALYLGIALAVPPAQASVVLGFVGTEPGTPITGQEDVIVYNSTGPTFGCSTPSGTPVCTPVTFDDVILTVNGTTHLDLGNIGPGFAESLNYPGGVFINGSITSLSFTTSLSTPHLVDDLGHAYSVDSVISLSGLPVNGSLALIAPQLVTTPEPNTLLLWLAPEILFCAALFRNRVPSGSLK